MTSQPAGSGHGRVDTGELRRAALHEIAEDRRVAGIAKQRHVREQLEQRARVTADLLAEWDAARERLVRVEAVCVAGEQSPLRYVFAAHLRRALDGEL